MIRIYKMPASLLLNVRTNTFKLEHTFQSTKNNATGFERRSAPSDVRWMFTIQMGNVSKDTWNQMEAFYDKVMATSGFFTAFDPAHQYPQGSPSKIICPEEFTDGTNYTDNFGFAEANGNWTTQPFTSDPNVRGAPRYPQKGDDTVIIGNVKRGLNAIKTGDYFSIDHGPSAIPMLYKATSDSGIVDSGGKATVSIAPRLRLNVTEGNIVKFVRPRSVFQFVGQFNSRRSPVNNSQVRFQAREVPEVLNLPEVSIEG